MSSQFRPVGAVRSHDPHAHLVFVRGSGHQLWDSNGRPYIDFIGGYSALNFGHAHPRLVGAANDQLLKLSFCTGANSHLRAELEQLLAGVVSESSLIRSLPPDANDGNEHLLRPTLTSEKKLLKVWLSSTGARAVEVAWKIAVANRSGNLMRFDLSYHGRSLATAHISDTNRSDALLGFPYPLINNIEPDSLIPFPRCGSQCDGLCMECDSSIAVATRWLERNSQSTSAVILEPAIGARGYYFACSKYYRRLIRLVRTYDLLVISDEVQMGLGRLGSLVASHAEGWFPDLVVFGKSLGGGIAPISAVVGDAKLMDQLPNGIESETFGANPLACRVAIEVLSMLDDKVFLEQVRINGQRFRQSLRSGLPNKCTVDGIGMCSVVDLSLFGHDSIDTSWQWVCGLREQGLLVHLTGTHRNRIAIIPPLNVDTDTLGHVANILSEFWKNR